MKDEVEKVLTELRLDPFFLFLCAFVWRYKKFGDVSNDVVLYERLNIVPEYVKEYVKEYGK